MNDKTANEPADSQLSNRSRSPSRAASFRVARLAVLVGLTLVFLMATHPARVSALLLVVPFAAIFACLYLAILEVVRFFQPGEVEGASARKIYRPRLLAAIMAGFPVLLLVLQSIMELNHWDVLIALAIFLLAYIFISRGTLPART